MWKYILIANNELKYFFRIDELADAIQAYNYMKQFYQDTTLNVAKYSKETHSFELIDCKLEDYKGVFSSSGQ